MLVGEKGRRSRPRQHTERYERYVARTEVPKLVLSLLLVPVVLMPFVETLSEPSRQALEIIGLGIWVYFAVDYLTMLLLSPDRIRTIRSHKLDLLLVVIPLLRPLRITRILRLARGGTAVARALVTLRKLGTRPGFSAVMGTVGVMILAGAGLATIAEHEQPDSTITSFGDGLWWAFVTCTTVGYGDEFPVTASGRLIAVALMISGISRLSVITANIAAYFVASESADDDNRTMDQLDSIERQLAHVLRELRSLKSGPTIEAIGPEGTERRTTPIVQATTDDSPTLRHLAVESGRVREDSEKNGPRHHGQQRIETTWM